jgi:hypothetical protein
MLTLNHHWTGFRVTSCSPESASTVQQRCTYRQLLDIFVYIILRELRCLLDGSHTYSW